MAVGQVGRRGIKKGMTLVVGVVCEAPADQRTACDIADRVICEQVDWIDSKELDDHRAWRGHEQNEPFLPWKRVRTVAKKLGIKAHGHFEGEPGAPDAAAARRALRVMLTIAPSLQAIMLVRDSDGDLDRNKGLDQARRGSSVRDTILIGVAHPKREAWVLAGFLPQDDAERNGLKELKRELGFNPIEQSHRLDAQEPRAKTDIKEVLGKLCEGLDRESMCWQDADLNTLREKGKQNGLSQFILEVEKILVPLLGGQSPRINRV